MVKEAMSTINETKMLNATLISFLIIMMALTLHAIIMSYSMDPANQSPVTLTNVSLSFLSMIVTCILYIGSFYDKWTRNVSQNAFIILIFVECVALYAIIAGAYAEGRAELYFLNVISNFINSLAHVLMAALLWFYISYQRVDYNNDKVSMIVTYATVIWIALLIINLFTGFIYTINADYKCVLVNIIPVFIFPAIIVGCIVFWSFNKLDSIREKLVMVILIVITLVCEALELIYPGLEITYVSALIIIMVIYSNIYIKRGYNISQKMIEIDNQRQAAMVSQIRPHFIFNVLSTIVSIDELKPMRDAIALFGKYLRGNLDTIAIKGPIPLTKELEHVRAYIALEKLRFESKLNVEYELEELDFDVPPLSIQVLVENAIRYGISKNIDGGTLSIISYSDRDNYYVAIEDDGVGFDTSKIVSNEDHHSGLESTRSRVSSMLNGSLEISSEINVGTKAIIRIPRVKTMTRILK